MSRLDEIFCVGDLAYKAWLVIGFKIYGSQYQTMCLTKMGSEGLPKVFCLILK